MDNVILTPRGVTSDLSKMFKVSKVTVWKALKGKSANNKARMLRKAALERGGVETSLKVVKPLNRK